MTKNGKIGISFFTAFFITAIDVAHKKIGGMLSGMNHSTSHSWGEVKGSSLRLTYV